MTGEEFAVLLLSRGLSPETHYCRVYGEEDKAWRGWLVVGNCVLMRTNHDGSPYQYYGFSELSLSRLIFLKKG